MGELYYGWIIISQLKEQEFEWVEEEGTHGKYVTTKEAVLNPLFTMLRESRDLRAEYDKEIHEDHQNGGYYVLGIHLESAYNDAVVVENDKVEEAEASINNVRHKMTEATKGWPENSSTTMIELIRKEPTLILSGRYN